MIISATCFSSWMHAPFQALVAPFVGRQKNPLMGSDVGFSECIALAVDKKQE